MPDAIFRGRYSVILLKLLVEASQTFEAAGVAYLHHALIRRSEQLRRILRTEAIDEPRKAAPEYLIEHIGQVRIVIPYFLRYLFETYRIVVIFLHVPQKLHGKLAAAALVEIPDRRLDRSAAYSVQHRAQSVFVRAGVSQKLDFAAVGKGK